MAITTRARMALFLSLAIVLVAGIAGAQYVGASSQPAAGSEPGSGGGSDGVAGICVAPEAGAQRALVGRMQRHDRGLPW